MATFVHTADTHLGYRQYHRPEREQDFLDAFRQVVDGAISHDAEALVHAGDFFHDSRPTTGTIRAALEELTRLERHDIDFLGVVGNHEETQADQWLDILGELDLATHLSATPTVVGDAAFYGIDHVPESQRSRLSYEFEPHEAEHAFLVLHGLVAPLSPLGRWELEHILGGSNVAFDAVLLGDDHTPRLDRFDDTYVTYPGSTERTATDQTADRVYNRVTTTGDEVRIEQVDLDTRPHVFIELELGPGDGPERVKRALDEADIEEAVVAIVVSGEGRTVSPGAIEEYGKDNGALVVRMSDRRHHEVAEETIDVTFADPDAAVQERLRQLGLSVPAYDVERRVRDLSIPKSNLADEVAMVFDERIEEDLDSFDRDAEIDAPSPDRETLADYAPAFAVDSAEEAPETENAEADEPSEERTEVSTPAGSSQLSLDDLGT